MKEHPLVRRILRGCMAIMLGVLIAWGCAAPAAQEGRILRNLTRDYYVSAFSPSWSPDGTQIAFTSGEQYSDPAILDVASGDVRTLCADGFDDVVVNGRAWVGDTIAFSSDREGSDDIWTVSTESTDWTRVTPGPAREWGASWYPGGKRILFQSDRSGAFNLWSVNADGTHLEQLTEGDFEDGDACVSPDGRTIVFKSNRSGNWDIWLRHEDGTLTNLTNDPYEDHNPSWSPDGRYVVFDSNRADTDGTLWALEVAGGELTQLTANLGYDGAPSWSPDGRWLAFESDRDNQMDIWLLELPPELIAAPATPE